MVSGDSDAVKLIDSAADDLIFAEADDIASFAGEVVPECFELGTLEERLVATDAFSGTLAFGFIAQIASGSRGAVDFLRP